jgi:N-acetylneuraminic acid mutarotase
VHGANRWSRERLFGLAACVIENDIYVFKSVYGGASSVFKYDTVTDAWTTLAPMPQAVGSAYHSVSVLNGLVYIVGAGEEFCDVFQSDPA